MIRTIRNLTCLVALLVASLVLAAACSKDATPPVDAAPPDRPIAPDDLRHPDLPPADLPHPDLPHPDLPPADLPPGPDSCCADLPRPDLLPDLAGKKKLIAWALCSSVTTCKPYCGAIGSKSEGWYDGCKNTLLNDPLTGSPYWAMCSTCAVICDAIGSFSEGWYSQCP